MRLKYLILLLLLLVSDAQAKVITVAVIDTGFGNTIDSLAEKHLCNYGHKDFTPDQQFAVGFKTLDRVPLDLNGHGTNIVGIIDKYADNAKYCIVIIKFYSGTFNAIENDDYSRLAIQYAINLKVDVINFSAGGTYFNEFENTAICKYVKHGGIFVAAAGNNGQNLDKTGNVYYPAMYKGVISVGNRKPNGDANEQSNFGQEVKTWEIGTDVKAFGITLTGTSQATAVYSGKIVNKLRK
jgi:hypothetical protein